MLDYTAVLCWYNNAEEIPTLCVAPMGFDYRLRLSLSMTYILLQHFLYAYISLLAF